MNKSIKLRLIVMNVIQWAVWGAYLTSMGQYLGSVGLGSKIGIFYAMQGIVSMFMPTLMGIVADKWIPAQRLLGICHGIAGAAMTGAAAYCMTSGAPEFGILFSLYSISVAFYMPSIALSNSVAFKILSDNGYDTVKDFPPVRVFGTVGFIASMWFVNFMTNGDGVSFQKTYDQFYVSGILGLIMLVYCFTLPNCPCKAEGGQQQTLAQRFGLDAFKLFKNVNMATFFIFAMLLGMVAETCPNLRIKFLSSHPSYLSDDIVQTILDYPNIMHVLHLPIQSASDEVLKRMNRGYTADMFIKRVKRIRSMIPDISIITDIMVGFCGETWEDFQKTVELVKLLQFDDINVFRFSMRSKTIASRIYVDDVCEEEKQKRYEIIKELNDSIKLDKMQELIGKQLDVIVEGKNSLNQSFGRDMNHRTVIIAADDIEINQFVKVVVDSVSPKYLYGHCANRQSCC